MLSFIIGKIEEKQPNEVIINVNGLGFSVNIPVSTYERLPPKGTEVKLYIVEVQAPYSLGISLYGFLTPEERELFSYFRNELKGVAGKRALDYVDKAYRSISIFKDAIMNKKPKVLTSLLGFHRKTADRIISALTDKFKSIEKKEITAVPEDVYVTALNALVSMGFKTSQAKSALEQALLNISGDVTIEQLIKIALKYV